MATIGVYGYVGYEMEIDCHIKTRVMFAIADAKLKRLAWYLYSQDMPDRWQNAFVEAALRHRKLDRNQVFGDASDDPTFVYYSGSDISRLAPQLATDPGSTASIFFFPDEDKTTTCEISHLLDLDNNSVRLQFDLVTLRERRTMDIRKTGRVWLIGVEPFSMHALKRGILGPSKMTHNDNPYNPVW
jgi:hypothetical protein